MIYKRMLPGQSDLAYNIGIIHHGRLAVERKSRLGRGMADAVESPHEIQMPGGSAEFTVCDHMIAQFFDLAHKLCDGFIFHFLQCRSIDLSFIELSSCFLQLLRS